MTEKNILKELKKVFNESGKGEVNPIETGIKVGIPDVSYTYMGTTGWIELKQTKQQKCGKIKIPYRPGQQAFLIKNKFYGGMCFVLIYVASNIVDGGMYCLIDKNFRLKYFNNIEELLGSCCWSSTKLNLSILSKLKKH